MNRSDWSFLRLLQRVDGKVNSFEMFGIGNRSHCGSAWVVLAGLLLVAGCSTAEPFSVPGPRVISPSNEIDQTLDNTETFGEGDAEQADDRQGLDAAQKVILLSGDPEPLTVPKQPDIAQRFSHKDRVNVVVENLPVRNFINQVFGELLQVNYVIVEDSPGLDGVVSLNSAGKLSSRQLYRFTEELLAERGLSIALREDVFIVGPADARTGSGLRIGYGRNESDVPDIAGSILQIIPMRYGVNDSLERTVRDLLGVSLNADFSMQAYFVSGTRSQILRAIDLINLFDQPAFKGARVAVISLEYLEPKDFVQQVTEILAAEGIAVGQGRILNLVPVERLARVIAFSPSDAALERLGFWATQLDKAGRGGVSRRYYMYVPVYSRAEDLGVSLASLIGGSDGQPTSGNQSRDTQSAFTRSSGQPETDINAGNVLRRDSGGRSTDRGAQNNFSVSSPEISLSVDTRTNSLIFFTTAERYESLLPLIRRLDIPPKQIVLEATIAEVTLTGEFANGVEFAFRERRLGSGSIVGGTEGGLGLPSAGLTLDYTSRLADQIRLRLQQSDSRINVLSNPILVVRDGVPATISVGNEVPTVGATASSPLESDRTVTTVLYRSTGLELTVTPSVNAQGLVVMEIDQSTTTAIPGSSGVDGAPIFFRRLVTTEVAARSGQTVLLAGLISESQSESTEKVPVLGEIPGVKALFSSRSSRKEKTELVVLITPIVLEETDEWDAAVEGLRRNLELVEIPR